MNRRTTTHLARIAAAAATAAAVVLAGVPASSGADRSPPTARKTINAPGDAEVKDLRVKWSGEANRDYVEGATVKGVGRVKLVCKPNNTIIKIIPNTRDAETQMWMAKFEKKNDADVVAVKNVRVYKFANANDDGTGGTGRGAHEGLNQRGEVENFASGYAYGLISQRPGRNHAAGAAALNRTTSFYLTWYWENMREPRAYQACEMNLRLVSSPTERIGLNWHGNKDAAGNTVKTVDVPGLGRLRLHCEPGRDNDQFISLEPEHAGGWVDLTTITGEGRLDDHAETETYEHDSETGLIGPVEIPRNGMMRLRFVTPDGNGGWSERWFNLSAYMVLNNANHPELNLCEIAVGAAADM